MTGRIILLTQEATIVYFKVLIHFYLNEQIQVEFLLKYAKKENIW